MGLRRWIERVMSRSAKPTGPTKSVTDPVVEKARHDKAAKDTFDIEVAIAKSRRGGFP